MQHWQLVNSPLRVGLLGSLSLLSQAVLYFLLATLNGSRLPFQDCNEKVTQLHLHCSCLWLEVGGVEVAVAEAAFLSLRKVAGLHCDFQFAQEWLELEPVFKLTKSTVPCCFLCTSTLFLSVWTTSLLSKFQVKCMHAYSLSRWTSERSLSYPSEIIYLVFSNISPNTDRFYPSLGLLWLKSIIM